MWCASADGILVRGFVWVEVLVCMCASGASSLSIHAQKYRKVSLNKSTSLNHGKYTDDLCCTPLQFSLHEYHR
jgi:hypothetical protein